MVDSGGARGAVQPAVGVQFQRNRCTLGGGQSENQPKLGAASSGERLGQGQGVFIITRRRMGERAGESMKTVWVTWP